MLFHTIGSVQKRLTRVIISFLLLLVEIEKGNTTFEHYAKGNQLSTED
jgi:hypothetical protein